MNRRMEKKTFNPSKKRRNDCSVVYFGLIICMKRRGLIGTQSNNKQTFQES